MIWEVLEPFIKNQSVAAHNGFAFDFAALKKTLEYYNIENPEYEKICTRKIYKKGLAALCEQYDIPLNHHDALSDARACAKLYMLFIENISGG